MAKKKTKATIKIEGDVEKSTVISGDNNVVNNVETIVHNTTLNETINKTNGSLGISVVAPISGGVKWQEKRNKTKP